MTGPEHYREAEHLLDVTLDYADEDPRMAVVLGAAQVHATLALAAATAMAELGDMPYRDGDAWHVTAATMTDPGGGEKP